MNIEDLHNGHPNRPHRAIINIYTEIHELLPDGSCSGIAVDKKKKVLYIDGQDRFITFNNLTQLLQEISNKCQK